MPEEKLPFVTIAIPAFNEKRYIGDVLDAFLNQTYTGNIEILVCDGGSRDDTVSIAKSYQKSHPQIKLLHNKDQHQTFALNIMIQEASGEIFLRADAHSVYANDYVEKCVQALLHSGAQNVGGAQRYLARNTVQAAVAFANKSYFGSGNASYKKRDFSGYVDTVYLGCFYTKTLREIGGFSVENIQNQDTELNIRLHKEYTNAVYLSADIKAWYYPRENLFRLWKQYYRYGKGRRVTHERHKSENAIRGRLPFLFLLIMIAVLVWNAMYFMGVISGIVLLIAADISRHLLQDYQEFTETQWKGRKDKAPWKMTLLILSVTAVSLMALAHALGFFIQGVKNVFKAKKSTA